MGRPRTVEAGDAEAGARVEYIRSRRVVRVGAWHSGGREVSPVEIPTGHFLSALGIEPSGPTWTVLSMEPPPVRGGGKILKDGDAKQIAEQLATALRDEAKVL